jgi:large subunit ribosomal protein L28
MDFLSGMRRYKHSNTTNNLYSNIMSRVCQLSGKGPQTGHNISHSERKTQRKFNPNVSKKTIVDPVSGTKIRIKLSTRAQRTLLKNPGKFAKQLKKLVAKKRS